MVTQEPTITMQAERALITQPELQARLENLAQEHCVTGAAVGVCRGDEVVTAVTGTTNVTTGAPVVADTLFAAGSVTKVFTTSLLMTLVDDGAVDLDAPVRTYLPEFTLADPAQSGTVTVRMLLNHSSGIPGTCMFDLPKSPEMLERYVERLRDYDFNSPPGLFWSYSNGGMVVAGRIVEVLTGQTFDAALADRVLRPLGLHATTDTNEMILDSTAVGHLVDAATGKVERAPRFQIDNSNGPAGATLWLDVAALTAFGRMHVRGGIADDGTPVLSSRSVKAMQTPMIDLPWGAGLDQWGLGWYIRHAADRDIFGHTGGNAGAHSALHIVPDERGVIAVLTNSITGVMLHAQLTAELLEQCFGIKPAPPPTPPSVPIELDLDRFTGTYAADDGRVIVTIDQGSLRVEQELDPHLDEMLRLLFPGMPLPALKLTPVADDGRFLSDTFIPARFVIPEGSDRSEYVYVGRIFARQ